MTIRSEWESFREEVVPDDAPEVQFQEMRRAFYAGARAMATMFADLEDDADVEPFVEAVEKELADFKDSVLGGTA